MKKMIGLFLIVSLALANISLANAGNFYVGFGGSRMVSNNIDLRIYRSPWSTAMDTNNPLTSLDMVIGYRLYPWIDLELERHTAKFSGNKSALRFFAGDNDTVKVGEANLFFNEKIAVYSLNAKIRYANPILEPYFMLGVGSMDLNLEGGSSFQGKEKSETLRENKPCAGIGLGVEFGTEKVRIFAEGTRWGRLDDSNLSGVRNVKYTKCLSGVKFLF